MPGTPAYAKRMADAVPDVVRPISNSRSSKEEIQGDFSPDAPIPTTIVTKVDSSPSHGEVPGTAAFDKRRYDAEPDAVKKRGDATGMFLRSNPRTIQRQLTESGLHYRSLNMDREKRPKVASASPIAADGGFGPMEPDDSEEDQSTAETASQTRHPKDTPVTDDRLGEDFDEFEAGAADEDFGDFDEGVSVGNETIEGPQTPPTSVPSFGFVESPFVSYAIHHGLRHCRGWFVRSLVNDFCPLVFA